VLRYIRSRLLAALPVLLGVSILVFSMLHLLPGDPAQILLGDAVTSAGELQRLRRELGFDAPLPVQYARFLGRALQGDLGRSLQTRRPVLDEILAQLPSTVQLTLAGLALAVLIGLGLGVAAATQRGSWPDSLCMALALGGVSMPAFWLGLMLIFLFALQLGWLPATGQGGLVRLVLPAVTLGYGATGVIARLVRSSMLEVLRVEYVTTARAKGLAERRVVYRHALRNALIPVITIVGLQFGALLGGTVVIETVFARQGIGRLLINAILYKDFPLVQGIVLFTASGYVLVNLLVDLGYALTDPRIRYD
jgi:peptide/nickel transport system permease protein